MLSGLRVSALRERLRSSLWLWPALAVGAAIVAGVLLPRLEGTGRDGVLGFAGSPEGARAILATVAGSLITVTSLTFSLTVVALQMASSQFTPRLMGTFLSDRGNQAVLSVFLGTFAYTLAVLRSVRSATEGAGPFVPDVAVAVGLVLTVVSVAMLVYFFDHLSQQLRVESVLAEVQRDTLALARNHLSRRGTDPTPPTMPDMPSDAVTVRALRSGYLQAVDIDRLVRVASEAGAILRLRPSVGSHVTEGTTLAWAMPQPGGGPLDEEQLTRPVHGGVHLGRERTLQQDVAFGVRQLVDIAARALSPGVNDPATAVATIAALAPVMGELAGRDLAPLIGVDHDGLVRAIAPRPSFGEILALACDQPRRYGRTEPAVLTELLRLLTDLAELDLDEDAAKAVRAQVDATLGAAEATDLNEAEKERVRTFARHARAALRRGHRVVVAPSDADEPAS